jgi:hypothetical protein
VDARPVRAVATTAVRRTVAPLQGAMAYASRRAAPDAIIKQVHTTPSLREVNESLSVGSLPDRTLPWTAGAAHAPPKGLADHDGPAPTMDLASETLASPVDLPLRPGLR